jgi:hypothetical protein
MTTLSRSTDVSTAPSGHAVRNLTVALVALLIATVLVLALALASSESGSGTQDGSIRVAPSAPSNLVPPSSAERNQPADLNGPGMRP